jgi:hypothetical protein
MSRYSWCVPLLLATGIVLAKDAPESPAQQRQEEKKKAQEEKDAKTLSGMSILGNQEAPKALVIVPWKSSELGGSVGIVPVLDDSRQPVDRDVFLRALRYYEIRSETTEPATAAQGRKS